MHRIKISRNSREIKASSLRLAAATATKKNKKNPVLAKLTHMTCGPYVDNACSLKSNWKEILML